MNETLEGLERLAEAMREPVRRFASLLYEMGGSSQKSLTLFGAVAGKAFDPQRQLARSVWVVDRIDIDVLKRLGSQGFKLGKHGIAAPLTMTPEYIQRSLDTFPLEFIEIKQRHVTLSGEDYFEPLLFDDAHVRLQCEREFKTILIGLRQGVLAAAGREKFIEALEVDAAEGMMRTLRGMLWLKGVQDAKPAVEAIEGVEEIAGRKLPGIRAALNPSAPHDWDEFGKVYKEVEALGKVVDGWS